MTHFAQGLRPAGEVINQYEIVRGLVAWLDQGELMRSPACTVWFGQGLLRRMGIPHPMVVVRLMRGRALWAPLTTTENPHRLIIKHEWRSGGAASFWRSAIFLSDGANVCEVPHDIAVSANYGERTTRQGRGRISEAGMLAIDAEIGRQYRRRHLYVPEPGGAE